MLRKSNWLCSRIHRLVSGLNGKEWAEEFTHVGLPRRHEVVVVRGSGWSEVIPMAETYPGQLCFDTKASASPTTPRSHPSLGKAVYCQKIWSWLAEPRTRRRLLHSNPRASTKRNVANQTTDSDAPAGRHRHRQGSPCTTRPKPEIPLPPTSSKTALRCTQRWHGLRLPTAAARRQNWARASPAYFV
jgi:hypothetical protein